MIWLLSVSQHLFAHFTWIVFTDLLSDWNGFSQMSLIFLFCIFVLLKWFYYFNLQQNSYISFWKHLSCEADYQHMIYYFRFVCHAVFLSWFVCSSVGLSVCQKDYLRSPWWIFMKCFEGGSHWDEKQFYLVLHGGLFLCRFFQMQHAEESSTSCQFTAAMVIVTGKACLKMLRWTLFFSSFITPIFVQDIRVATILCHCQTEQYIVDFFITSIPFLRW